MRAFIVGVDSLIGRALGERLRADGHEVVGTTRNPDRIGKHVVHLDLDDSVSFAADLPKADVAFFCAAMTKYDKCREDEQKAWRVNAVNPPVIAKRLVESGTRVVLLSTSAVLDCSSPHMTADRPRQPASIYGRTKAQAELAFLALGPKASVLRLTKVLTSEDRTLNEWISKLSQGVSIECADDFRISPITLEEVIQALGTIAGQQEGGIFQVSGASDISYAEVAWQIADRLNVPKLLVRDCPSASIEKITPDVVTAYTSLDVERLSSISTFVAPEPRTVIDSVLGPVLATTLKTTGAAKPHIQQPGKEAVLMRGQNQS